MVLERFGISKQLQTPLMAMGGLFMSRSLDMTNPDTINYIRAAFILGLSITFGMIYLAYQSIESNSKNTNDIQLKLKESDLNAPNPLGGTDTASETVEMTATEYDRTKLYALAKQTAITTAIMSVMHLYAGFVPPLLIQSYMMPLQTTNNEIIQIHVFNKTEQQDPALKRPFSAPASPFAGLMGNTGAGTDTSTPAVENGTRVNTQTKPSSKKRR